MPGAFHRHVLVTPGDGTTSAWVEDDYHHMGVTVHHDGGVIRRVEAEMIRAPWSTCPGATAQLAVTFTGVGLDAVAARGDKVLNCTHLHDMTVLAVAHAHDIAPLRYQIEVSDAVHGERVAEITRDDMPVLRLVERDTILTEPIAAAGKTLFQIGEWIATLCADDREAARLLRWAAIIAHGRAIPMGRQSDASRMPANCFTFQDGRKELAQRVGTIIDFSSGVRAPLGED